VRGDQYAVALGLLENGEIVVGVLGCPNLPMTSIAHGVPKDSNEPVGCLFTASKGAGTFVQSLDGKLQPQQVYVSNVEDPAWATFCESYESGHSNQSLTANIARVLGVTAPPVRIDSQAKYGAMARGDAVIYLRFPHPGYREKIWDHAAGSIVITGMDSQEN
jgi:3'(2'), 5'-bisphosphate nucleotidase/inositol polyphosphate 1-phosphatase